MNLSPRVVIASFSKEMRIWKRSPRKLSLVFLLPILFFSAFIILMGGVYYGSGVEVALVIEEQNPGLYTNGLIEILQAYDPIPPRLVPIEMDAERASSLFDNGDILLVITIPSGFEYALSHNESTLIHIRVANIHEDLTKNLRMPVIRKLDIFYQNYLEEDATVTFDVELLRSYTPPRLAYMAWTITIYAIMVGSIFSTGSTLTQEFEQETWDELNLSNQSPHSIYLGKMLSGVVISYISTPVIISLGSLLFGTLPHGDIITFIALTLPLSLLCSAMGLILGALTRNSVFMVPLAALGGLFYWIVGGGIAPLELVGDAFGIFDEYVPISNVYRSLIRMFVEGSYTSLFVDLSIIWFFAIVLVMAAPTITQRLSRVDVGQKFVELKQRRKH
ncbi:ABC transporter permease [Candidatus Thorarchaeota archaeon]|nr:MAG: ABC transporter permease [Candidatus Thorarchaeota archaeon]